MRIKIFSGDRKKNHFGIHLSEAMTALPTGRMLCTERVTSCLGYLCLLAKVCAGSTGYSLRRFKHAQDECGKVN